jgi:hypothetical protein
MRAEMAWLNAAPKAETKPAADAPAAKRQDAAA